MAMVSLYAMVNRRYRSLARNLNLNRELAHWQSRKAEVLEVGKSGYLLHIDKIGLKEKELKRLKELLKCQAEVVIADVDQDGRLLSYFGYIEGLPMISKQEFLTKVRFFLEVCGINDEVVLKKHYRGNRLAFLNELSVLHHLASICCDVPAIKDVDFDNLCISISFIPGCTLQEMLAQHGALIRDGDIKGNHYLMSLSSEEMLRFYFNEGKRTLSSVVDQQFIDELYIKIKEIHKAGIELYDIKWGNVIVEDTTGKPFLVDFDSSRKYSNPKSKMFTIARDRDIEKFNLCYNDDKLTYKRIKDKVACNDVLSIANLYAPVYIGYGLRFGNLWNVNVGYGRWYFILKDSLPPLHGKRILSLGVNCAFNEIQMLRYGAKEVIGFEIDEQWIAQGLFFKEAFEWADNASYNFKYINADMAKLPYMGVGNFDMAIALCSLYYLSDEDMARVAEYVSTITSTFIVQCNVRRNIGRPNSHSYEKASVEYISELLVNAGFSEIKVVAPKGYGRPVVIGKKRDEKK
jgi:tRNA A-37 threonylcarbamoyl transferase component Bud32